MAANSSSLAAALAAAVATGADVDRNSDGVDRGLDSDPGSSLIVPVKIEDEENEIATNDHCGTAWADDCSAGEARKLNYIRFSCCL